MRCASETPLTGGRTTRGVVRLGDTVRRPIGAHSPFVHAVLDHLCAKNFTGAPRFEGIDEAGHEMLSWLPGHVPPELTTFSSHQLATAARLLRRLHDATRDAAFIVGAEVICHGDASPCNCVFVDDLTTAFIDFDAAHAGSRREDLGYAAWLWLDIGNPDRAAWSQGRRLARFFIDYGMDPGCATSSVRDAQRALAARRSTAPDCGRWARACEDWMDRHAVALKEGLTA